MSLFPDPSACPTCGSVLAGHPWRSDRKRCTCRGETAQQIKFLATPPSVTITDPFAKLAAYDRIRRAMDLPPDCDPADVAKAVEETLSSYLKVAGSLAKAMENFPARMPTITQG